MPSAKPQVPPTDRHLSRSRPWSSSWTGTLFRIVRAALSCGALTREEDRMLRWGLGMT